MIYNGYCPVLKKEYRITADTLSAKDLSGNCTKLVGLIDCDYASNGGDCPYNDCPILEQNGVKQ